MELVRGRQNRRGENCKGNKRSKFRSKNRIERSRKKWGRQVEQTAENRDGEWKDVYTELH